MFICAHQLGARHVTTQNTQAFCKVSNKYSREHKICIQNKYILFQYLYNDIGVYGGLLSIDHNVLWTICCIDLLLVAGKLASTLYQTQHLVVQN